MPVLYNNLRTPDHLSFPVFAFQEIQLKMPCLLNVPIK